MKLAEVISKIESMFNRPAHRVCMVFKGNDDQIIIMALTDRDPEGSIFKRLKSVFGDVENVTLSKSSTPQAFAS